MKNLLMLVGVLALSALFLIFWDSPPEMFGARKARIEALPTADSYMRNTVTSRFNAEGVEAYTLKAETGLYYSTDDRFDVENPELLARHERDEAPPWHVTARKAYTLDGGQRVVLSGDVEAWQDTRSGKNTFITGVLHFLPEDNRAETDDRVTLAYPGGQTTGIGMRADFNARTYHILNQVQGIHHAR
jgi:lipopolysaccharide export system protein LptC